MNTEKFDTNEGAFDIQKVKDRIASEAELISNYTVEQNVKLKDFMTYLHKCFQEDSRVVTALTPEELAKYFRGLEIIGNHSMESVVITKPANSTAAGKKQMVKEATESGATKNLFNGGSVADMLAKKKLERGT